MKDWISKKEYEHPSEYRTNKGHVRRIDGTYFLDDGEEILPVPPDWACRIYDTEGKNRSAILLKNVPIALHTQLKVIAAQNSRTLTSMIVWILEKYVREYPMTL